MTCTVLLSTALGDFGRDALHGRVSDPHAGGAGRAAFARDVGRRCHVNDTEVLPYNSHNLVGLRRDFSRNESHNSRGLIDKLLIPFDRDGRNTHNDILGATRAGGCSGYADERHVVVDELDDWALSLPYSHFDILRRHPKAFTPYGDFESAHGRAGLGVAQIYLPRARSS